jgi:hypothetical protein
MSRPREKIDWSPERITLLLRLCADGLNGQQIADRLGFPRSIVIGKFWRMGLKLKILDDQRGRQLGFKCSAETREKNRAARLGKKCSPETRARMSGAKLYKARAAGLLGGAEEIYAFARAQHFPMREAVRMANRALRRLNKAVYPSESYGRSA